MPGRITELLVEEGQRVEAGERLLAIDPEKRNLEVLDAQARLTEARASVAEATRGRGPGGRKSADPDLPKRVTRSPIRKST